MLHELNELYHSKPALSTNVDIHLVTARHAMQPNVWRNIARTFARTDWVLLWDADFEPCTDYQRGFESFRQHAGKEMVEGLDNGEVALVIPSFEWVQEDPLGERFCPASKEVSSSPISPQPSRGSG
jgi:hypothetical protein